LEEVLKHALLRHWFRIVTICLVAHLYAAAPAFLHAQQTGSITGTVSDPGGNVLPHANIVINQESTTLSRKVTSDSQGHFSSEGLPPGRYTLEVSVPGFSNFLRHSVVLTPGQSVDLPVQMTIGNVSEQVTVSAGDANSIATQLSPVQTPLDTPSARSEIGSEFIRQFASSVADYGEILQIAPGTFSVSPNGIGLGQDKTYFRGFADGQYDITWDGIPFNDTNGPTHHSWAFFPSQWLGGIDFDRSPGTASTIGPTPFGGSINLLSKPMSPQQSLRGSVSYGSFNTLLVDGQYDSGEIGKNRKTTVSLDVQRLTSDGFQTYNYQQRIGGDLKAQYKLSDKAILTAFSGWLMLDNNTPNTTAPTRAQVAQFGYNFLLNNDPTSPYYYGYNGYHLPTDFSYVGFDDDLGHGWKLDLKPYTYSYKNHQHYTSTTGPIGPSCAIPVAGILPCASDQLNGYHKFGEVSTLSQTSRYGIFRTGLWYEWATTNRYLYPTNPITGAFGAIPSYHEHFDTSSYQPYAEYSFQYIPKLTVTAGLKYAYYNQNLTQYADNGKTVGNLGGLPYIINNAGYHSYLPSADVNYRIKPFWSAYAQFSQGSAIPPSSVFDVKNGAVQTLPKPSNATTYQTGSVLKLNRFMLDGDIYYIKFQNAYTSFTPATGGFPIYYLGPDSATKGFEVESNVYLNHGLSLYANGTVGKATYVGSGVPSNLWVANTPSYTEGLGFTYQERNFDLGLFQKRVGPMWGDNKSFHDQVPIAPFSLLNLFLNYTIRNSSRFDQTKIGLSFNNMLNAHDVIGVTPSAAPVATPLAGGGTSTYLATTTPAGGDLLTQTPGRSVMLSITFGLEPKR
jgi:iron complex outermembrane receptor protein